MNSIRITRFGVLCLALGLAGMLGCKEPVPTAESVDQSITGQWKLDREETLKAQVAVLKDAGLIKTNGDRDDFERGFALSHFDFELTADAKFSCTQGTLLESGTFRGHWKTKGDKIDMVQTHEGDKHKKDRISGTYTDEQMRLIYREQGIDIPYIFRKHQRLPQPDAG